MWNRNNRGDRLLYNVKAITIYRLDRVSQCSSHLSFCLAQGSDTYWCYAPEQTPEVRSQMTFHYSTKENLRKTHTLYKHNLQSFCPVILPLSSVVSFTVSFCCFFLPRLFLSTQSILKILKLIIATNCSESVISNAALQSSLVLFLCEWASDAVTLSNLWGWLDTLR